MRFNIKTGESWPLSAVAVTPDDLATTNIKGLIPKPFSTRDLIARIQELGGGSTPAEGGGDDATGATAA